MTTASTRPALLEVLPHPRRLIEFGPHAGAHRVALRAGIALAVPLGVLWATGHLDLALYAVFGAFTALYGRAHGHLGRLRMQATAATALVTVVVAGTAIGSLPAHEWIVVPVAAAVAAGTTFLSDALHWHPPGSLFFVFALAACAAVPSSPSTVPVALLLAVTSAAFAMLVSAVGLARPAARRAARTPARAPRPERARSAGAHSQRREDHTGPREERARLRVGFAAAGRSGVGRRMLTVGAAVLVAGLIPTASGLGHPYWAMVAAVAALGAADTTGHLVRAGHRVLGTLLGVALAALLLLVGGWSGSPLVLVAFVVLLQVAAELFVGRNYGVTMVFVTPLALIMAQLAHPLDEFAALRDRTVETLLGAAVGVAVSVLATAAARRRAATTSLPTAHAH